MTAAAASWMSTATFREVLKRTKWHLQRASLNILLSPIPVFPPCHPLFPALLWPWIYIGYKSAYRAKHHAVFDIHHLLMDCSLIAAGECLAALVSHWLIHGEGPPTEGPHLLSALGALLLTYNGCDTQKITCGLFFLPFQFGSISLSPYSSSLPTLSWDYRWVQGKKEIIDQVESKWDSEPELRCLEHFTTRMCNGGKSQVYLVWWKA